MFTFRSATGTTMKNWQVSPRGFSEMVYCHDGIEQQ